MALTGENYCQSFRCLSSLGVVELVTIGLLEEATAPVLGVHWG